MGGGLWQNSKRLSDIYCGAQWMGATAQLSDFGTNYDLKVVSAHYLEFLLYSIKNTLFGFFYT